jgi:3'-phosphoadenosine 5'-phosphosulfate sulfotransferase (PAPS reductase)/FAD synthetase
MPLKFWDEAFLTAVFLINRLPYRVINYDTPFDRLHGQSPEYSFLYTFGCTCCPNLRPYNSRKLEFRSKQCVFLGYSNEHKGFKCLDLAVGRIYVSKDVFDEQVFPFSSLHLNAGAQLHAELNLLPDILLNPSSNFGDAHLCDQCSVSPLPTNASQDSARDMLHAGENSVENGAKSSSNGPYFMCAPVGDNTRSEANPSDVTAPTTTESSSESPAHQRRCRA